MVVREWYVSVVECSFSVPNYFPTPQRIAVRSGGYLALRPGWPPFGSFPKSDFETVLHFLVADLSIDRENNSKILSSR